MYIPGLIPLNSVELAKAVPIGVFNAHLLFYHIFHMHCLITGSRGHSPRTSSRNTTTESPLPDLVDLSEYQPLYHHLGIPRRLGTAGSMGASDFQGQQTQDTVYR